ncbi:MAG: DUF1512 domain-containing protein [Desulfurococcales archaeon]|nr:DUF1512 domain-containing protein [Desulfurococcales archaeon]
MDGSSDWASTLLVLLILTSLFLNFTDIPQKMQLWRWASFIRKRLYQLSEIENESRRRAIAYLSKLGVSNPREFMENFLDNFFVIEPVSKEPTDIIRRLKHLLRVRNAAVKAYVSERLGNIELWKRNNTEVLLEIVSVIRLINKIVRHYFQLGLKYSNWVLVMQLALEMPQILRLVRSYNEAIDAFLKGTPVGDGVGPLVARHFIGNAKPEEVAEETDLYITEFEGRKLYIIKARGPGATVGWPGEAVEKVVERLGGKVARIITVDAALRLESEETGEVAYGVGAAIGDPGPEKIAIERTATKYSIPLEAVVVKMSDAEALNTMTKKVYEGVQRAVEIVKKIIREKVREGESVILVGIGNTVGIL